MSYLIYGRRQFPDLLDVPESPAAPDGVVRMFGEWEMQRAGRVGPAGDFNDDGYADFLIGGPTFNAQTREAGAVHVMLGGPSLPERIELNKLGGRGFKIGGAVPTIQTGWSVGPFGDLNADGQTDFFFAELALIGTQQQKTYVIYGPKDNKRFIRGDANQDSTIDLADPIVTLGALFLGAGPIPCDDAADCDDDGLLNLTDAIYSLNFQFLGGPAPPAPYPTAGPDPTPDALDCRKH